MYCFDYNYCKHIEITPLLQKINLKISSTNDFQEKQFYTIILICYYLLGTNSMLQALSLSVSIKQAFISSQADFLKYHLASDSVNLKVISITPIAAMNLKGFTNNPDNFDCSVNTNNIPS